MNGQVLSSITRYANDCIYYTWMRRKELIDKPYHHHYIKCLVNNRFFFFCIKNKTYGITLEPRKKTISYLYASLLQFLVPQAQL